MTPRYSVSELFLLLTCPYPFCNFNVKGFIGCIVQALLFHNHLPHLISWPIIFLKHGLINAPTLAPLTVMAHCLPPVESYTSSSFNLMPGLYFESGADSRQGRGY